MLVNVVSKEIQVGHTVGREAFENSLQVLIVGGAGNENIVYVGVGLAENLVYQSLECLGSVPEVEGHLHKFKQSEGGGNRRLEYIRKGH